MCECMHHRALATSIPFGRTNLYYTNNNNHLHATFKSFWGISNLTPSPKLHRVGPTTLLTSLHAAQPNTPLHFDFDSIEMLHICCWPGEIYKKIDDLTF